MIARIGEVPRRANPAAKLSQPSLGKAHGNVEVAALAGCCSGRRIAVYGPSCAARPRGLVRIPLECVAAFAVSRHSVVLDRVIERAVGTDKGAFGYRSVRLTGKTETVVAAIVCGPVKQRNIGHCVDG